VRDTNETPLSIVDLLQPEHSANPYPFYQHVRSFDPVYWDERMGGTWVLTRYQDVISLLRDSRTRSDRMEASPSWLPEGLREVLTPATRAIAKQMLFLDPPDHTRLRGLVSKAFTPRQVEALRPQAQQVVDELLDAVLPQGKMEVVSDLAYPVPIVVIAHMLGVPPEDSAQLTKWSGDFGLLLDGSNFTPEAAVQALYSINEFMEYFRRHIRARRNEPKDDILQMMINAEEQGDTLSEDELLGNCILLLAAGHFTTTHLIGNGLLALLRDPEQWQLLSRRPELIPVAVPELLRFDSPVQFAERIAKEDLQIGGKQVEAGQSITFALGAANHDPEQFSEPDLLKVDREENRHLAFGQGIHFCLGAPLARLEAEVVFTSLVQRLHEPQLATEQIERTPGFVFRNVRALPITFS
jgi:cytochrome P450